MRLKKHRGSRVRDSGIFLKEEDYNGNYALEIQTENDEAFSFLLREEDIERLYEESSEKMEEESIWDSILPWR